MLNDGEPAVTATGAVLAWGRVTPSQSGHASDAGPDGDRTQARALPLPRDVEAAMVDAGAAASRSADWPRGTAHVRRGPSPRLRPRALIETGQAAESVSGRRGLAEARGRIHPGTTSAGPTRLVALA
jgi:hypothetical protein